MKEPTTTKRKTTHWSFALALLLAAVLLVLAFRGVDWQHMLQTLRQGKPAQLVLAFVIVTISYFLRGIRWGTLLSAEQRVTPLKLFWATQVGYLSNSFLPARAGEVIRSILVSRDTPMSASFALATTITERILDAVVLVLIGLVALATLDGIPDWLRTAVQIMAVMGVVGTAGLFIAPRVESLLKRWLAWLPLSDTLHTRIADLMEQFLLGMRAFQHPVRGAQFLALTMVVWLADALFTIVITSALHLSLSLPQALLLLAALGLASALPSTPGYVGIYQFVAVTVLPPFGFAQSEALALIIAFQVIIYLVVLVWGLPGIWLSGTVKPADEIGP